MRGLKVETMRSRNVSRVRKGKEERPPHIHLYPFSLKSSKSMCSLGGIGNPLNWMKVQHVQTSAGDISSLPFLTILQPWRIDGGSGGSLKKTR